MSAFPVSCPFYMPVFGPNVKAYPNAKEWWINSTLIEESLNKEALAIKKEKGDKMRDHLAEDILLQLSKARINLMVGKEDFNGTRSLVCVAQEAWLYVQEFQKNVNSHIRKAKFSKTQERHNYHVCRSCAYSKLLHVKAQKLWKSSEFPGGNFDDNNNDDQADAYAKFYEHNEKAIKFALNGNKDKAEKYLGKLAGDMDSIWVILTDMSEKNEEIRASDAEGVEDKGEYALKKILDSISTHKTDLEKLIADLFK